MSDDFKLPPRFGGKLHSSEYFNRINAIIRTLGPLATLRATADHLNEHKLKTPTGLPWNKQRLANYLRTSKN